MGVGNQECGGCKEILQNDNELRGLTASFWLAMTFKTVELIKLRSVRGIHHPRPSCSAFLRTVAVIQGFWTYGQTLVGSVPGPGLVFDVEHTD